MTERQQQTKVGPNATPPGPCETEYAEDYVPPEGADPDDVTAGYQLSAMRQAARDVVARDGVIKPPVYQEPISPAEMRTHDHDEGE